MNHIQRFVFGSSLVLVCWLAATFFNDVPTHRYPKLDKNSMNVSRTERKQEAESAAVASTDEKGAASSFSR